MSTTITFLCVEAGGLFFKLRASQSGWPKFANRQTVCYVTHVFPVKLLFSLGLGPRSTALERQKAYPKIGLDHFSDHSHQPGSRLRPGATYSPPPRDDCRSRRLQPGIPNPEPI